MREKTIFIRILIILNIIPYVFAGGGRELISMKPGNETGVVSFNQIGFQTDSVKTVFTEAYSSDLFYIARDNGEILFKGELKPFSDYRGKDDRLKRGDFSSFTQKGDFLMYIPGAADSFPVSITKNPYEDLLRDSLRTFYFQRASIPIEEEYAGEWARKAGHPDNECLLHESTGKSGTLSASGGWYDAGDYGKYIVNGGITVGTLLGLFELLPETAGIELGIPESGNDIPDLLDEVKFELDWMKSMQDSDGGVFFKVAGLKWPGFISPSSDTMPRYIIGKSTGSTLNFAAVMAQASRVLDPFYPDYAADCLSRAEAAWQWALENPSARETHVDGSGDYGDTDYSDEFFWAAAELMISSGKQEYLKVLSGEINIGKAGTQFRSWMKSPLVYSPASWQNVRNLAYFSLAVNESILEEDIRNKIRESLISYGEEISTRMESSPYHSPLASSDFIWGSNGIAANYGVNLVYASVLSGDGKFRESASQVLDYLMGNNALGQSFVTAYGAQSPRFPHNRIISSNYSHRPVPGFLVGGPNKNREDRLNYPETLPEKMYLDVEKSYASNETAINWQAPFSFLCAYLSY